MNKYKVYQLLVNHKQKAGKEMGVVELIVVCEKTEPVQILEGYRLFNYSLLDQRGRQRETKPIEGYENLNEAERKMFIVAHNKHLGSIKGSERDQYGLGSIVGVSPKQRSQQSLFDS